MVYAVIILIVAGIIIYLKYFRVSSPEKESSRLREQCRSVLNMPPGEADQIIDRLVQREQERNPGKTEDWYLDKVLYDLEKDKK